MSATKKELQELVGFDYIVKGNLLAAYTNVEKHLRLLLSQPGMTEALPMPRNTLLICDYLDEFGNLSWSYFSGSQTSISMKCVDQHNLLNLILRLGK